MIDNFKQKYFKEYEMFFSTIHNDEGNSKEIKGHVHMFLSGFNSNKNDFDIKRNIFDKISKEHNLDLDFNDKENHKTIMNLFQQDFYDFFNDNLSKMGVEQQIALNEYKSIDELNKRLEIKKSDLLTIDEKHQKLANQIIEEKFLELDTKNEYMNLEFEVSENILSDSLKIKTNLAYDSSNDNARIEIFSNMLKVSQYFSKYVKKLNEKIDKLKDLLLAKTKEIMNLKSVIKQKDKEKETEFKELENNLKIKYENQMKKDIQGIIGTHNINMFKKDKEIEALSKKNDLLFNMKLRYKKFERVFNVDIRQKIRDYEKSKKSKKKDLSCEICI
ncbi:MAG: hypothetical protein QM482_02385 [Sulfurospirillum sp.]